LPGPVVEIDQQPTTKTSGPARTRVPGPGRFDNRGRASLPPAVPGDPNLSNPPARSGASAGPSALLIPVASQRSWLAGAFALGTLVVAIGVAIRKRAIAVFVQLTGRRSRPRRSARKAPARSAQPDVATPRTQTEATSPLLPSPSASGIQIFGPV